MMFKGRFLGKTPHIFLLRMACATAAQSKQAVYAARVSSKIFLFPCRLAEPPRHLLCRRRPGNRLLQRAACVHACVCLSGESGDLSFRQINRHHQEIPHSGFLRTNVACTGQKNMPSMMMMPYVLSPARFLPLSSFHKAKKPAK